MLSIKFLKRCFDEKCVDTRKYRYVIYNDIRNNFAQLIRYERNGNFFINQKILGGFYKKNRNIVFKEWSDLYDERN